MGEKKERRTPEERRKLYDKIRKLEQYGMQHDMISERLGISRNLIRQLKMDFKDAA